MNVVSHSYGGMCEVEIQVFVGKHAEQTQEGLVRRCTSKCKVKTDDARSHRLPGAQLWADSSWSWLVARGSP